MVAFAVNPKILADTLKEIIKHAPKLNLRYRGAGAHMWINRNGFVIATTDRETAVAAEIKATVVDTTEYADGKSLPYPFFIERDDLKRISRFIYRNHEEPLFDDVVYLSFTERCVQVEFNRKKIHVLLEESDPNRHLPNLSSVLRGINEGILFRKPNAIPLGGKAIRGDYCIHQTKIPVFGLEEGTAYVAEHTSLNLVAIGVQKRTPIHTGASSLSKTLMHGINWTKQRGFN